MPNDKKPKSKELILKISPEIVCGTVHGHPKSSTLVKDIDVKAVNRLEIFKDAKGDIYLVLKE